MKITILLAAACLTASFVCGAAELTPRFAGGEFGIALTGVEFPETLARDLKSGLENRILILVTASAGAAPIDRKDLTVVVKYDLWDEVFNVRTFVGERKMDEATLKQTTEVIAYLADLRFAKAFAAGALPDGQEIVLRAEVLINPIERAKIERLRQWVAENSTPGDAVTIDTSMTPLTSKPNDLFNKIFDQYIRGADIVAPWRVTITSKAFRPELLRRAAPTQ